MDAAAIIQAATAAVQALNALLPLMTSTDRATVLAGIAQADALADEANQQGSQFTGE